MSDQQPSDYVADPGANPRAFEQHIKSRSTWLRLLFMIVMAVLYAVARIVITVVAIVQFLYVLFTGETNPRLKELGSSLATYDYQIVRYLTFNTEERPFPFDTDWPSPRPLV
jgi:Domain of unknown function (DUF4389)